MWSTDKFVTRHVPRRRGVTIDPIWKSLILKGYYFPNYSSLSLAKNITTIHVPDDAVGKGICFPPYVLPVSESIGVYVTHIKSPDCFWVQLVEHGNDLKELEENIG